MFNTLKPELVKQMVGQYAIRFNLLAATGQDNETGWQYDEIIVKDLRYETVVAALIHFVYSIDAEIAIINNHINDDEEIEWQDYQNHRAWAKSYAGTTLGLKGATNEH